MKKKINRNLLVVFFVLLFISVVSVYPYFLNQSIFKQDDLIFHRTRLENYFEAIKQLDFFPKIFPFMGLNFGYGADLFYPSIFLLPFAFFRLAGLPFVASYHLYQLVISFATAYSAFYVIKTVSKSQQKALLFSCFYTLSTYRLIDQSVRAALGETLAFIFLPLVMLGIYSIFIGDKPRWRLLVVSMSCLIASHLITALYTAVFLLIYCFFNWKKFNRKRVQLLISTGLAGLSLSAWFIFPYIEQVAEIRFNFSHVSLWDMGLDFNLGELFINSVASVSAPYGDLKPNIGIFLLAAIGLACVHYSSLSSKAKRLVDITLVFVGLSTNTFPWWLLQHTPLAAIQFPWRLLAFVSFFSSLLAVELAEHFKLKNTSFLIAICCFLTLGFNIHNLEKSTRQNDVPITNQNYRDFHKSELGHGKEYLVEHTDYKSYVENPGPIVDGIVSSPSASKEVDRYKYSQYTIETHGIQEVQLPKFYYKGYQVLDNQKPVENYEKNGLVTVKVNSGLHNLTIFYKKTMIQRLSLVFSLLTILILSISYGLLKKKKSNSTILFEKNK